MKKMILLGLIFLSSCFAFDKKACLENVKKTFPNYKVYTSSYYTFIVVDSTNIYLVQTNNFLDTNISLIKKLELQ